MNKILARITITTILIIISVSCITPNGDLSQEQELSSLTVTPVLTRTKSPTSQPSETQTPTLAPTPQGETIIVTSIEDSGNGTFRQALDKAQSGDTISFDSTVFSPDNPETIFVLSELPGITQGALTIDASNAGVILDGSKFQGQPAYGLQIYSDRNTISGLQIVGFSEGGIVIGGEAKSNIIGGDPNAGIGPIGQGNLISNNGMGIGIWDIGASNNTVTGNLIGIDITRTHAQGNEIAIRIAEGASHNMIGPGNVIAYNQQGVTVVHHESVGNVISQNSIHSNAWGSINLKDGGNGQATAPYIIDYDLEGGTIKGSACPNCIVEIFSTNGRQETTIVDQPTAHSSGIFDFGYDGREGAIFEGKTTADSSGVFTFDKGVPFSGQNLTVTSTHSDYGTSSFSAETFGTQGSIALQEKNDHQLTPLTTRVSSELEFNRIGDMVSLYPIAHADNPNHETPEELSERMSSLGMKWMRLSLDKMDWIEIDSPEKFSQFHVDPLQDQAIDELLGRGIQILYTIVYWDPKIQTSGGYSRFRNEDEIQRYLDYVQFIVEHFEGRIEYYSLLNEPNIDFGSQQYVEAIDYINLVRRTVPIIKQADPNAKIIIGEVTPLVSTNAIDYLFEILQSDVLPLVDGICWHGSGDTSPEYKADEYYEYQALLPEIRRVASENGFSGEFWVTEMHWRTPASPHPSEYDEYSGRAAAKYLARGILMHQGMDFVSGIAENITEYKTPVMQNLATLLAGAEPFEINVEIETQAEKVLSFGFLLPNGDHLLAIWSDGIAVDHETGLLARLTIPATTALEVTGIDILNNFEQRMITSIENGILVIDNLFVKDYPIILLINNASSP